MVKNPPANAGDVSLISGLARYPGVRNSNPFQYSCLESFMDRATCQTPAHGAAESQT